MRTFTAIALLLTTLHSYASETWEFDVFLDEKPIGSHTFELQRNADKTILVSEADFKVKFLFVTAFEYEHRNKEVWVEGCLSQIEATTNNNGERLVVEGERDAGTFEVSGKDGRQELDGCVQTFAYWNPSILEASNLLNAQTGEYESVDATLDGEETLTVDGRSVVADRYRLSAKKGDLLLWYTKEDGRWIALDAPAKGDRRIRYTARQIPDTTPDVVARITQ